MERPDRIVDFNKYCPTCRYKDIPEKYDPCNECLCYGGRQQSEKPMNYDPKDKTAK